MTLSSRAKRLTTAWNKAIKNNTQIFFLYWFPALLWVGMIALFSSQAFGASHTGGVLVTLLSWFHLKLSVPSLHLLHFAVRKTAHFVAYGVLSALFFRAVRGPLPPTMWRPLWALIALGVCLAVSSGDEFHQLYTPGRGGSAYDVLLDMTGALFAQLLILAAYLGKPGRTYPE